MDQYLAFSLCCIYSIDYVFGLAQSAEDDLLFDPIELILNEHNKYRAMHGAPALEFDEKLSASAQEWADHLSSLGASIYRPSSEFGQNLWVRSNTSIYDLMTTDKTNPVKLWYNQFKHYPGYYDPALAPYTGAFTQVVWVGTQLLGIGISHGHKKLFVVCFYEPPGNERASNYEDTVLNYSINVLNLEGYTWSTPPLLYYTAILAIISVIIAGLKLAKNYTRLNLF